MGKAEQLDLSGLEPDKERKHSFSKVGEAVKKKFDEMRRVLEGGQAVVSEATVANRAFKLKEPPKKPFVPKEQRLRATTFADHTARALAKKELEADEKNHPEAPFA